MQNAQMLKIHINAAWFAKVDDVQLTKSKFIFILLDKTCDEGILLDRNIGDVSKILEINNIFFV